MYPNILDSHCGRQLRELISFRLIGYSRTQLISFATSLTATVATWAHVGGLIGGLLFGFATITSPAAFLSEQCILVCQALIFQNNQRRRMRRDVTSTEISSYVKLRI